MEPKSLTELNRTIMAAPPAVAGGIRAAQCGRSAAPSPVAGEGDQAGQAKIGGGAGGDRLLALAGKGLPVMKNRGPHEWDGRPGFITMHPSFLLRLKGEKERHDAFVEFVADLKAAKKWAVRRKAA
jgi:hypothetical protein